MLQEEEPDHRSREPLCRRDCSEDEDLLLVRQVLRDSREHRAGDVAAVYEALLDRCGADAEGPGPNEGAER